MRRTKFNRYSDSSFTTVNLGDDLNFKTGQKSIKNLVHSKSKEDQANSEN